LAPGSVACMLRYVRAATNQAIERGYLRVSPFGRRHIGHWIHVPPPSGKRHLTREEIRAILDVMNADVGGRKAWEQYKARRLLAAFSTCAWTGLRAGELFRLRMADLDLAERVIHVRPRKGHRLKTPQSAAALPIAAAAVPFIESWCAHRLD